MYHYIEDILKETSKPINENPIGFSRNHRPLYAHTYGTGKINISLIGGCHADEPIGPLLLRKLVQFLDKLPLNHIA